MKDLLQRDRPALMLLGGYILSSIGPATLGVARDLTGDFRASMWLLVGVSAALVAASALLAPDRLARGVGFRRARSAPSAPSSPS